MKHDFLRLYVCRFLCFCVFTFCFLKYQHQSAKSNGYEVSSILMLFYYLVPLQNDSIVMSWCVQFTFGDKREVCLLGKSALPVSIKESMWERKKSIGPKMKYWHANLNSFCEQVCIFNFSSLSLCTCPSHKFVVCLSIFHSRVILKGGFVIKKA